MKFLRNPEIQRELICMAIISASAVSFMALWQGIKPAVGIGAVCLAFIVVSIVNNFVRYRKISYAGEQLEKIFHGEDISLLEDCYEGDLAMLFTQVKKLVRVLREQRSLLEKEKKLLADFMADMSHQMKTPLTSIHLVLSFLQEEELSAGRRRELVKKIAVLTERMDWMVYAMLRMASLEAGTVTFKQENFSMERLIRKCYESLAVPMDLRGVSFRSDIDDAAGMVGDFWWMTEAVTNVIKNCMEHTPEGGEVFVRVVQNPISSVIYVEDTGCGIAEEDLPHIFERFYRGKNADENSVGIGLALSRQIIISQNGNIRARNKKKGSGAVFEIRMFKSAV